MRADRKEARGKKRDRIKLARAKKKGESTKKVDVEKTPKKTEAQKASVDAVKAKKAAAAAKEAKPAPKAESAPKPKGEPVVKKQANKKAAPVAASAKAEVKSEAENKKAGATVAGASMYNKGTSMMRAGMKGPSMGGKIQYGAQSGMKMGKYAKGNGKPAMYKGPGMILGKHMKTRSGKK